MGGDKGIAVDVDAANVAVVALEGRGMTHSARLHDHDVVVNFRPLEQTVEAEEVDAAIAVVATVVKANVVADDVVTHGARPLELPHQVARAVVVV